MITTALFPSRLDAEHALERVRELHLRVRSILVAGCGGMLSTLVSCADVDNMLAVMRSAKALDLHLERDEQPPQNWFSHHYGRVTGIGVPPGQGDAEAGDPS
jgi:hypothetical protein